VRPSKPSGRRPRRAGRYDAIRVDADDSIDGHPPRAVSYWFAPEVGLVKLVYDRSWTKVLTAFTPGKD
jgi:hypothetical protein